jgi:mycothiol synthase
MLSNFRRPTTPEGRTLPSESESLWYRAVRPDEINSAFRLILSENGRPASDGRVVDFLSYALGRGIAVTDTWVAGRGSRMSVATLPMVSPGRTMLMLLPGHTSDPEASVMLTNAICGHYGARGTALAQVLLDEGAPVVELLANRCQFVWLADLIYLQSDLHRPPAVDPAIDWVSYSVRSHKRFADAILKTYEESLDCPQLNGVRDVEDIIAGHKAAGEFRPDLWQLAVDADGSVLGVAVLAPMQKSGFLEVVYLGVCPEKRGRGIGKILFHRVMSLALQNGLRHLTLAVDAKNTPALRLYYGCGMKRVQLKHALMRDLRSAASSGSVSVGRAVSRGSAPDG